MPIVVLHPGNTSYRPNMTKDNIRIENTAYRAESRTQPIGLYQHYQKHASRLVNKSMACETCHSFIDYHVSDSAGTALPGIGCVLDSRGENTAYRTESRTQPIGLYQHYQKHAVCLWHVKYEYRLLVL